MIVHAPFEITLSFNTEPKSRGSIRVYLSRLGVEVPGEESPAEASGKALQTAADPAHSGIPANLPRTWIFQASPTFSDVKGALRSVEVPVFLVHQFRREINAGDRVFLWECGPGGGIIALAEVSEAPRVQPEPAEQLRFIREGEKFAGDQFRAKLRILKRITPVIPRKYLLSRPELRGLSILRCARGTNFRVTQEQALVLQKLVEQFTAFFPASNGAGEKWIVFAEG